MTATGSSSKQAEQRLAVRRKQPALVAIRAPQQQFVDLIDGRRVVALAGDWLITRGKEVLDVCPTSEFTTRYESVGEGALSVPQPIRQRIEHTTGIGTTRSAADLVEAVERLARISIGSIVIDFTPGQLEEIKHRAGKRGRTVEEELRAAVARIKDEIFWRGA